MTVNIYATNEPTPIFTLKKPDGEEVKLLKSFESGEIYPDKTTLVMEFNREKECFKKYMILKNAKRKPTNRTLEERSPLQNEFEKTE